MKNKKLLTFGIVLMLLPVLFLSVTVTQAQAADKPIIVCTTSAVGNLVEEYLGNTADIMLLVQPGLCPADFEMAPSVVYAVSNAKILFKQGILGEFWLDGLLEASGNEKLAVVTIPGLHNTPEGAKNYIRGVGENLSQIFELDLDSKISELLSFLYLPVYSPNSCFCESFLI